jgi:hypothetical protein
LMNLMWNTDKEYMAGLRYIVKNFRITTHCSGDMGLGFGLNVIIKFMSEKKRLSIDSLILVNY